MIQKYINSAYYFIIPLLIIGISLGYTSFLMSLLALIPLLCTSNRHTLAIFLVMYGGTLGGIIRHIYPFIPTYGLLIVFMGFILMWDLVLDLFKHHSRAIIGILITLLLFSVFYNWGPKDENATNKFITICTHGVVMVFAYYAFDTSKRVNAESLTQLLLVAAVCMFTYSISAEHMSPGGLFNYNWFRDQSGTGDLRSSLITYQQAGMIVLFSFAFYVSQIKIKTVPLLLYLVCVSQLILTSGCRQAILGLAVIIALRFSLFRSYSVNHKHLARRMFVIIFGLALSAVVIYNILENLQIEVVSNTLEGGDTVREAIFEQALLLFVQNPVTGVGLGGFDYLTGMEYPHNFFLELLCETGLVGTISALLLLIIPLIWKKQGILHITASNQFFFLIIIGTFVRVMVSSDLTESIELFSAVFAISSVKQSSGIPVRTKNSGNY